MGEHISSFMCGPDVESIRESYFNDNYDVIADIQCVSANGNYKRYIDSDARHPYICRFCGRQETDSVKFKDDAHAISNCVGNRIYFIKKECVNCNHKFSEYENHLAKYLDPGRTFALTRGKRGIPGFENNGGRLHIDAKPITMVKYAEGEDIISFGEDSIKLRIKKDTYIPILAYKAIVTMALSVIPDNEVLPFQETIDWLCEDSSNPSKYDMSEYAACVIERIVEGSKPLDVHAKFYRKKPGKKVPYALFLLEFDNYIYQIIVPCIKEDAELTENDKVFFIIPSTADGNYIVNDYKFPIDLSSYDPIKGEMLNVELKHNGIQRIPQESWSDELGIDALRPLDLNEKDSGDK